MPPTMLLLVLGPDGSSGVSSYHAIQRMAASLSASLGLHQTLGIFGLVRGLELHSPT